MQKCRKATAKWPAVGARWLSASNCPNENLPHLHMSPPATISGGDLPSVELTRNGVALVCPAAWTSRMIGKTLAANWPSEPYAF